MKDEGMCLSVEIPEPIFDPGHMTSLLEDSDYFDGFECFMNTSGTDCGIHLEQLNLKLSKKLKDYVSIKIGFGNCGFS